MTFVRLELCAGKLACTVLRGLGTGNRPWLLGNWGPLYCTRVDLAAVIDWYSRKVLAWRLSNTLDSDFCVDCLEQSLRAYGTPDIFNTDQGCQFTSVVFTGVLTSHDIAISMDGRGRALDNIFVERLWRSVKHEDVYLKGYVDMLGLQLGLTEYFGFYNTGNGPINRSATSRRFRSTKRPAGEELESWTNLLSVKPRSKPGQRRSAARPGTTLNSTAYCLDYRVHLTTGPYPDG